MTSVQWIVLIAGFGGSPSGDQVRGGPWPTLDPAVEEALARPRPAIDPRSFLEGSGITAGFEPAKAFDGDPRTYWASNSPDLRLPKDVGAVLAPPRRISRIEVRYVVQDGPWAPDPGGADLEVDAGRGFERVAGTVEVKEGTPSSPHVAWTHTFPPVLAKAFRIVVTRAARRPAVAEIVIDVPGGMPHPWDDGSPATGVPLESQGAIEIAAPEGRPAAAIGLLLSASGFRPLLDFTPRTIAVEVRLAGGAGWTAVDPAWRIDDTCRGRRSLAVGEGDLLLWTPLPATPIEAVRISGLPRSARRLEEVLVLSSLPARGAPEPSPGAPRAPGVPNAEPPGIPRGADLPEERIEAIARHPGDLLAETILSRGEPGYEELAGLSHSFPGSAALGLPFAMEEAGVLWNGSLLLRAGPAGAGRSRLRLLAPLHGPSLVPLGADSPVKRRIETRGAVRVELEWAMDGLLARETALVSPGSGPEGDLHARFSIENPTGVPRDLLFAIAMVVRERGPAPWEGEEVEARLLPGSPRRDEASGVVEDAGRAVLRARGPLSFHAGREEAVLLCEKSLAGGEEVVMDLVAPLGEVSVETLAATGDFDAAQGRAGALWSEVFGRTARLSLPEERLEELYRASIAGLLIAADGSVLPYGAFPGVYDGDVFGVEESWEMEALASFGLGPEAVRLLEGTYFRPEHLDKRSKHHQYRNGLTAQAAWRLFELTRDPGLLAGAPAVLLPLSAWTREARRRSGDGTEPGAPLHAGLLPRHLYGGDIEEPCHALYGNLAAWRGLRDTALFLEEAGRASEAGDLRAEATAYRARILEVSRAIRKMDARPPFLPFKLEETGSSPSSGEYYQLFGPLVLETGCLPRGGDLARLVMEAIEKGPRLVAGEARFGTPLGLDAHYTRGLLAEWLRAGRRAEFLLGFYAQQAFAFDRQVLSAPEVMPIFFRSADRRAEELRRLTGLLRSDPCAAGPATFLLSLRDLLVLEERDGDDLPTGRLEIGAGIPRAWMREGARIEAGPIATAFGPVSLGIEFSGGRGRLSIEARGGRRAREYVLRLPGFSERAVAASSRVDVEL